MKALLICRGAAR